MRRYLYYGKSELDDKLSAIPERFYTPKPVGILGRLGPPFDVSKPNFHDNKQDFLAEMGAVVAGIENVDGLSKGSFIGWRASKGSRKC